MSKAPNPFSPNSVVSPTLFAGRASQVNKVLKKLTKVRDGTPASFFFLGDRGIGKTALAKLTLYVAQAQSPDLDNLNFLTAYYSVEKGQTSGEVLQAALNELTDEMSQSVLQRLGARLGDLLKGGKFSIGAWGANASIETPTSQMKETTVRDQVVSILSNIISALKEDKADNKDGILFVLDEVNNLADLELCAQLIRGVTTTLDVKGAGNISFILIGYKETADAFFEGDPSARRLFDHIRLDPMPDLDAEEILKKGFASAGVSWDEEALVRRVKMAGGYPHAVQLLGHNVYEVDSDGHISELDWSQAILDTAIQLQTKEFAGMYRFIGKRGDREIVLDVLAGEKAPISKSELAKKCHGKNTYRLLARLRNEGSIIENDDECIEISSQLLRLTLNLSIVSRNSKQDKPD